MKRLFDYERNGITVAKRPVTLDDGVALTIYDFKPEGHEERPVLLFVAGWLSALSGWHEVLTEIAPTFRVVYMESREKCSAELPDGPLPRFDIDRLADDIAEVVDEMIYPPAPYFVAGSSLGSTALARAMARKKVAPEGAFLISPVSKFEFPGWGNFIIRFLPASFFKVIRYIIVWYLVNFRVDKKREPEQAQKYRKTIMEAEPIRLQANARALTGHGIWEDLGDVEAQTIIIGASADKLHGVEEMNCMAGMMPDAHVEVMDSNREAHSERAGSFIAQAMAPEQQGLPHEEKMPLAAK